MRSVLLTLTVLLLSGVASAETVSASATSIVSGRLDPRDGTAHTVAPFLELITLEAHDLRNPVLSDLNLVVSG